MELLSSLHWKVMKFFQLDVFNYNYCHSYLNNAMHMRRDLPEQVRAASSASSLLLAPKFVSSPGILTVKVSSTLRTLSNSAPIISFSLSH